MLSPDPSEPGTVPPGEGNVMLRGSNAEDAEFVRALAQRAFLAYGSYDDYAQDWLGNDAVSTTIAEVDGERAGFYMVTTYHDAEGGGELVADLVAIVVAPEHQSRGIGKRLLAHAFDSVTRAEPRPVELWLVVAEGNSRARRFFTRHGFHLRDGVGVYPAGQRALRMVKLVEEGT